MNQPERTREHRGSLAMLPISVRYLPQFMRAVLRFRDYAPQKVTFSSLDRWLRQFEEIDRRRIMRLLLDVNYISENKTRSILVGLNENLLSRLKQADIPEKNVIYIQIHDPGSSSAVMLNMVRDASRLERRGCSFIDSKDVRLLNDRTQELEKGGIIYVDDFAGTGNQFCEVRDFLADYIVGTFAEFFLVVSICEEALYRLGERGVEAVSGGIHSKADRPLHPNSTILDPKYKERLRDICVGIDRAGGLGYKSLASMVVLYRNAPNSVPVLLRGNVGQDFVGVLPRTTDLPPLMT